MPGVTYITSENAISLSTHDLPASDHFFTATDFDLVVKEGNLIFLFGQASHFQQEESFRVSLEIMMPISFAIDVIYKSVFENPGANGVGTFIESVKKQVESVQKINGKGSAEHSYRIAEGQNSHRVLSSNYAITSMSRGQAMIEFFEASPDLIVNIFHRGYSRPGDGLKPVIAVILSPVVLYKLLMKTEELLKPSLKDFRGGKK